MSSYLTFRFVASENMAWSQEFRPEYPWIQPQSLAPVKTVQDISAYLQNYVAQNTGKFGILLSGGIDSAIVASYCPKGTKAYSIRFNADGAIDETVTARQYCDYYDLDLTIVDVYWEDYITLASKLMKNKKTGLHAVEVALYKAAQYAVTDGIKQLYCGNGADSNFGGMDKLLSKDWLFNDFVQRYTYIEPAVLLKEPISLVSVYERFRKGAYIDVLGFLRNVHGVGIIQAFTNALSSAACTALEPYESMILDQPLDLVRIRNGEPKYLLKALFKERYPNLSAPNKIPFARPMNIWLRDWEIPQRKEFIDNPPAFTGEQKWLIYCLDILLDLIEGVHCA
jgi:hypothetical protein